MNTGLKIALTGVVALAIYNELQKRNPNPKIRVSNLLTGKYNARTIPPFGIFVKPEHQNNPVLLKHELVHWHQYQNEGLINFTFNYLSQHRQKGYDLNPYEIEARLLTGETQYCAHNYTECVRNGNAVTINNPKFRL